LRGYTYARESSEFTVYHLRQFLEAVASCDTVEKIHILAHSRGCDVVLSTLNDFRLQYHRDTEAARRTLKLGNVILAAPDIDLEVAQQRVRPDRTYEIVDRLTLYITPDDDALGLAELLFSSLQRVGSTKARDLSPQQQQALRDDRLGFDVIDVRVRKKGAHEHTYWIDSPAVLSDVILLLRDDLPPGRAQGRPLIRADTGVWEIHDGYPNAGAHAPGGQ
jgi:esterase/lipase superfamily enzyme